ncbi:MAG: hypothetical protein MJ246_00845 [Clostridia bacterium]|nr:hypothetical protein [Clostridia bacterium]
MNCDFKEEFDSKSGGKTPYNRTYLNGNHVYLKKDAGPLSLSEKLCSDKTVLSYINLAIENGTQTGAYFQSMKQEEDTTRAGDALVW